MTLLFVGELLMTQSDDLSALEGVGPATEEKLIDAGFSTYQAIAVASSGDLADKADIGDTTAATVIASAKEMADIGGFKTGVEENERRMSMAKITTGVPDIDRMLAGGVETGAITEFYGGFGSGKSQMTHQLSINVQLPVEFGGANSRAIFIDTEDSFRPERITQMVQGLDTEILEAVIEREGLPFTAEDVKDSTIEDENGFPIMEGTPANEIATVFLRRIHLAKAYSSEHQVLLAEKALEIANEYADDEFPVGLIAVDSVMAYLRSEFVGRGELAPRQQRLGKHLATLKQISELHNTAIVLANQVMSNPDSYFGDPTKPIGGNILGHTSTFRLYIRNSKGTKRVVRLVDAPNLEDGEAVMRVEKGGLKPE
jgi:DNA repair protein RadA